MEPRFKIGDVVRLKSGGPSMTVNSVGFLGDMLWVVCFWFDTRNRHQSYEYKETLLEFAAPSHFVWTPMGIPNTFYPPTPVFSTVGTPFKSEPLTVVNRQAGQNE